MMKFIKKNKKGFTLIELIVVIAILGILAAIVIPRVGQFREQADVAHDNATLRTVQGAVNMYHANNGRFPTTTSYAGLGTPLAPFLELQGGAMPTARSAGRTFQYNPTTGIVSLTGP